MSERITERRWWKGTPGTAKAKMQRYGRQVVLFTPIVWRWSWCIRITLFPEGPWLVGVQFGKDAYDDEPFFGLGLGQLLSVYGDAVVWMTYTDYHQRMDEIEELRGVAVERTE